MSTKTHKKLCWNCDGYVHVYEMKCPYCGAGLSEYHEEKNKEVNETPISDAMQERIGEPQINDTFQPPYDSGFGYQAHEASSTEKVDNAKEEKETSDVENPLTCLLLLIPGTVLFLLGLSVALFSKEGVLTFQFKSKFWFVYLFGSMPLLYLGYRMLFPKKESIIHSQDHSFTNPLQR